MGSKTKFDVTKKVVSSIFLHCAIVIDIGTVNTLGAHDL